MFDFLKKIGDSGNSLTFYRLYTQLREWNNQSSYPYMSELPDDIIFPPEFWGKVIQLYKYTRGDGFERAISVFWADGDLILSSVVKGTQKSVKPSGNVVVSYSQSKHEGYATKEVRLDGALYSKKDVYYKKIPQKIEVKYLFNMHTHPPHKRPDGTTYYSFFSAQDIKSLIQSKAVITGMIGDKLWMLFRTKNTPTNVDQLTDAQINMEFLIRELHISVYTCEFKGKLRKVELN